MSQSFDRICSRLTRGSNIVDVDVILAPARSMGSTYDNNENKNASNTWLCSCRLAQRYRSGVISWFRVGFASHASRQHRKNAKMHRRVRTFPGLNLHWSRQSPLELLQQQPASLWPTKSVGYLGTVLYGTCTCRSRLYDRNIRVDLLVVGVPSTRSLVRYISTRLFVL